MTARRETTLYLTESDIRRHLTMKEAIALMRAAFLRLDSGEAINQPRRRLRLPTRSVLHYMAAGDGKYFGAKIYSTHPRHGARFLFLLYRAEDAALLAVMEANYLGQIRTGAASGLASSVLARPDSRILGIIGSGFQARSQLEAVATAVPLTRARVWSRSEEKRNAFARDAARDLNIPVEATATAEEAVRGADIVSTATNSAEPVVAADWIAPGTHINAMGSNQAQRRELPPDLVHRATLVVADSLEQSRMEAGDLILAFRDEDWNRVVELQDVAAGKTGRRGPAEITLFKSIGLAVEDVIAAGFVYERALESGGGKGIG